MPATAREPSGTLVDVLCGQPEQKCGLRSASTNGVFNACCLPSISLSRASMVGEVKKRPMRRAMTRAMLATGSSPAAGSSQSLCAR